MSKEELRVARERMTLLYAEYGELIIAGTRVQQRLQQLTTEITQQEKLIKELEANDGNKTV